MSQAPDQTISKMNLKTYLPVTNELPRTLVALESDMTSMEFEEYSSQYQIIARNVRTLVRKITSMKIYCCEKYEVYHLSNTDWLNDLDRDKLALALNAAALEDVRIDVLQWVAKVNAQHLPAEIVSIIYDMMLESKYQGHEHPWDKIFQQNRFSVMISASGIEYDPHEEVISRLGGPCFSIQSATEMSESGPWDYSRAMDFDLALDNEDGRYQDDNRNYLLDEDFTKDLSAEHFSEADTKNFPVGLRRCRTV